MITRPFLTAEWRDLVLLNYEVPAGLLAPLVPHGTELDFHDGGALASLVGFRFVNTRLRGWPIPFHRAFEEVNLRFYVRRETRTGQWRRGVVFISELVPKRAVAWLARAAYNEPYRHAPMSHRIDRPAAGRPPTLVSYRWRLGGVDYALGGDLAGSPADLSRPSEAEFITEHYWGYTRQRRGGTLAYEVAHPPWRVARLEQAEFRGDAGRLYGAAWASVLGVAPRSAFYAEGSDIAVGPGRRLGRHES